VWANVKEGNTLLLEYNQEEDGRLKDATTLRMGLPKFFTLNYDAISETKRKLLPREAEAAFFHNETLAQVRKATLSGAKIEVQQSLKTNGDCAQITWCSTIDSWAVASKNVCLVARTPQDVKKYYPD
jgi:hypothetical protein